MNKNLYTTIKAIRAISKSARIKAHRNFTDFFADRIVQAGTEETLLSFYEKLSRLMDSDIAETKAENNIDFFKIGNDLNVLEWIRKYPRVGAMIACLPKQEQIEEACSEIIVEDTKKEGTAYPRGKCETEITITTLSPLAHGADTKAGNATLYRRMQVLSTTGSVLSLPFYSGNAIRGQLRDLLGLHFLQTLGIKKSEIALWFFHALFAGGALEEDSASAKAIQSELGGNGATKAEGIYRFRDTLPNLSVLGTALGNRILCGRVDVSDFRPDCIEWTNGNISAAQLFTWEFLTRREDNEGHEDGENKSMIANTECLKAGCVLHGGIDYEGHISELEKSAFGLALNLFEKTGKLGAENRRGFGKVKIEIENKPKSELYENYIEDNKDNIIAYLKELSICTR